MSTFTGAPLATHTLADWPMPNPPSTKLDHPQTYAAGAQPGVVIDQVTGLHWPAAPAPTELDYPGALAYCAGLTDAGGGWRLPSRIELVSIVDYTTLAGMDVAWFDVGTGANPSIDTTAFPDTGANVDWSQSLVANFASSRGRPTSTSAARCRTTEPRSRPTCAA